MRLSDLTIVGLKYIVLKSSTIIKAKHSLPVGSPLEQRVNAQLLVEEGNGKPPHHHLSSHFPSLDVTSVPPLVSSRTCLTAEHLSSSSSVIIQNKSKMKYISFLHEYSKEIFLLSILGIPLFRRYS